MGVPRSAARPPARPLCDRPAISDTYDLAVGATGKETRASWQPSYGPGTSVGPTSPLIGDGSLIDSAPMLKLREEQVKEVGDLTALHAEGLAFRARQPNHSHIFRGQSNDWPLATSLERACKEADGNLQRARLREAATIREFRRRYHHYAIHIPPTDHALPWLSLMQHYGAPTRLLDWTYSIDVAAYFAVESVWKDRPGDNPNDPQQAANGKAAVWMLNATWATRMTADALRTAGRPEEHDYVMTTSKSDADEIHFGPTFIDPVEAEACVCPVNPFVLNERLTLQKGVFTCVGEVGQSFEANLLAMEGTENPDYLMKLVIPRDRLRAILAELYEVNISLATLFPGLDGFAQALRINVGSVPVRREQYPELG
ncbi:MAG: FRG domain-containing protein [Candidatus Rokuibacteriota bacterium]